jgi:hypothetical protein
MVIFGSEIEIDVHTILELAEFFFCPHLFRISTACIKVSGYSSAFFLR